MPPARTERTRPAPSTAITAPRRRRTVINLLPEVIDISDSEEEDEEDEEDEERNPWFHRTYALSRMQKELKEERRKLKNMEKKLEEAEERLSKSCFSNGMNHRVICATSRKLKGVRKTNKGLEQKVSVQDEQMARMTALFECPICYQRMCDPMQANSCGHTFCRLCLARFHKKKPGQCPYCKAVHHPNRNFPAPNVSIRLLLNSVEAVERPSSCSCC
ncbi:hypothetical protein BD626DRAFT_569541 [Schizophyllum amplum]|uniref:RING-type domain-containing protein n=1 Tax=Schizophyllum amplum TaxID=97359 RepID=A0A550CE52_9AGAR|nr:hypothetical protein BD626DRAFT_569541 [Auriculariopsis ampla]